MRALLVVLLLAVTQVAFGWIVPGKSLVISGENVEIPKKRTATKNEKQKDPLNPPKITDLEITSDISNRYAQTTYKSTVLNPANITQETKFFVVTPEEAYITAFVMYINGINLTASVKENRNAENIYKDAVNSGYSAAHVIVSERNSNEFAVNVNVGANSSAVFFLSCEELLTRKSGKYSDVININSTQYVKNLKIIVNIEESANLSMVDVLPLTTEEGFTENNENLIPKVNIIRNSNNTATITFNPTIEEQKKYAIALKTFQKEGFSGQFIVTYDVERNNNGGEILVQDGYFVHFFAPTNLPVMPKYLIFVVYASFFGRNTQKLRETVLICLKNLNPDDRITIIELNNPIKVYNLDAFDDSTRIKYNGHHDAKYKEHQVDYTKLSFPPAYPCNADTMKKAIEAVGKIDDAVFTNIYEGLRAALHMVKITSERTKNLKGPERQPMILFFTDTRPIDWLTIQKQQIVKEIYNQNIYKVPIFSMSVGEDCDKEFLRPLSSKNYGFSRQIHSTIQMESFCREISSPFMTNVTFKYIDNVTEHTRDTFPILFSGNEIVVSGKIDDGVVNIMPVIECKLLYPPSFVPIVRKVKIGNIERQWAYLTTKQYLEMNENDNALDLAIDYSFVTTLISMDIDKPNYTAVGAKSNDGGYTGMERDLVDDVDDDEDDEDYNDIPAFRVYDDYDPDHDVLPPKKPMVLPEKVSKGISWLQGHVTRHDTLDFLQEYDDYDYDVLPAKKPMVLPEKVSKGISWLQAHVTRHDTLDFLQGSYKFGFDRSNTTVSTTGLHFPRHFHSYRRRVSPDDYRVNTSVSTSCTTLLSEPGKCKFLDEADSVYRKIVDEISFKDYFCVINNKFVGLCCPV